MQIPASETLTKEPPHLLHRRVHPDRGGGSDDGRRLPRLLRSHQGVAVHAGIGRWFNTVGGIVSPQLGEKRAKLLLRHT